MTQSILTSNRMFQNISLSMTHFFTKTKIVISLQIYNMVYSLLSTIHSASAKACLMLPSDFGVKRRSKLTT